MGLWAFVCDESRVAVNRPVSSVFFLPLIVSTSSIFLTRPIVRKLSQNTEITFSRIILENSNNINSDSCGCGGSGGSVTG